MRCRKARHFRKTQIIANGKADAAEGSINRLEQRRARRHTIGLLSEIGIEQMHFAVNPVLCPIASRNNSCIKGIPLIVSLIHGVYKLKVIARRKRIHSAAKRPIN